MHFHREGALPLVHPEPEEAVFTPDVAAAAGTALVGTEIAHGLRDYLVQIAQHHVIAVEQQQTIGGHSFGDLHFGLQNAGNGTQEFNVGRSDVDDYRHIRLSDLG